MNCCSVGTGSPLQPPTAITDVPEAISSAAADCEPFVAADHGVCVAASRPASSALVASSFIQPPVTFDARSAVGIDPWCGVAAVTMENVVVPANPASMPTASAMPIGAPRGNKDAEGADDREPDDQPWQHVGIEVVAVQQHCRRTRRPARSSHRARNGRPSRTGAATPTGRTMPTSAAIAGASATV